MRKTTPTEEELELEKIEEAEEESEMGEPDFPILFAGQAPPKEYSFTTTINGNKVQARFRVKKLNSQERNIWLGVGQGRIYREENSTYQEPGNYGELTQKMLELAICDFELPTGDWDEKNDTAFMKRYGTYYGQPDIGEKKKAQILKELDQGPYTYMFTKCVEYNGWNPKKDDGAEPS